METPEPWPLDLLDWKRHVFAMYEGARAGDPGQETADRFRAAKDVLFARHPQSPVPAESRGGFTGLRYFPYRHEMRVTAELEPAPGAELLLPSSGDEPFRFLRVGFVRPVIDGHLISLAVFWLTSYGGGIFIPFRDTSAGTDTYGAGRYLWDTVKGADLGLDAAGHLVLDFNYAYNPSCSYDPQWHCPLAPPESRIDIPIAAGERA